MEIVNFCFQGHLRLFIMSELSDFTHVDIILHCSLSVI